MARYDFRAQRLFVEETLQGGATIALDRDRAHYLSHVLRLKAGDAVLLFNGRDGEWRAEIGEAGKKGVLLRLAERLRAQTGSGDLIYAFAPLKHARLDYMVQKAVEMGASRLAPVITRHTQVERVNRDRMRANAIEAAEQCGVLAAPAIDEERKLPSFLESLEAGRLLVFCDEEAESADPVGALRRTGEGFSSFALLVGPEGGFAAGEREMILRHHSVTRISLGPRILRADTAAVAALAVLQSALGDWRGD